MIVSALVGLQQCFVASPWHFLFGSVSGGIQHHLEVFVVDFPLLSSTFVENSLACGASFLLAFCLIFAWDFIRHHKATILGYFFGPSLLFSNFSVCLEPENTSFLCFLHCYILAINWVLLASLFSLSFGLSSPSLEHQG